MVRIFLDTNILLHGKPLQDIAWETYEAPPVTIVITRTNIRELDKHKDNHPKNHIRGRARKALQRIEAAAASDAVLRPNVILHVERTSPSIDFTAHGLVSTATLFSPRLAS